MTKTKPNDYVDKLSGLIIGSATGDALGAPFERLWMKNEYDGTIKDKWKRRFRWGIVDDDGIRRNMLTAALGQYTDDTEMMLVLIRSIIKNNGYDKEATVIDYMRWANIKRNNSMGTNTRNLFKGVKTLRGYRGRFKKHFNTEGKKDKAQSNGCLMRCAPLAVLDNDAVRKDCEITNPNEVCVASCQYHTSLIRTLFKGSLNLKRRLENVDKLLNKYPILKIPVKQAILKEKRNVVEHWGWCLHGVYISTYCYLHFNRFDKAMDFIFELKGDIDTNMCIGGSVMGVNLGLERLKQEEITKENIRIIVSRGGDSGDFPRSEEYLVGDYKELAKKLSQV